MVSPPSSQSARDEHGAHALVEPTDHDDSDLWDEGISDREMRETTWSLRPMFDLVSEASLDQSMVESHDGDASQAHSGADDGHTDPTHKKDDEKKHVSATPAYIARQLVDSHDSTPAAVSSTIVSSSDDTPSGVSGTPTAPSKGRRILAFATPTDGRLGHARPSAPLGKESRVVMGN